MIRFKFIVSPSIWLLQLHKSGFLWVLRGAKIGAPKARKQVLYNLRRGAAVALCSFGVQVSPLHQFTPTEAHLGPESINRITYGPPEGDRR